MSGIPACALTASGHAAAAPPSRVMNSRRLQRVGLSEWDNAEQAQAWTTSQARKDLNAERDKAIKIIRQYIVEAAN